MPGNEHARTANGNGFNLGDGIVTEGADSTLPTVGQFDYGMIRGSGRYLADKTMFIDRVLSDASDVILFTRPRRFGKSINLTMLDAFLNIEHRGNTWFEGTAIDGIRKYDGIRNTFPVVRLDFKDTVTSDEEEFMRSIDELVHRNYAMHEYLLESERIRDYEKEMIMSVLSRRPKPVNAFDAMRLLCEYTHRHHGIRPVVLVDEFDTPVHETLDTDMYRTTLKTVGKMISSLVKGNTHLFKAVMFGITPIAHASMMSGLNNITINSVLRPGRYADCFGMTEAEVAEVCREAGLEGMLPKVGEYYDGYVMGEARIFNPYSVMRFADSGELDSYWTETGTTTVIADLMSRGDGSVRADVLKLMARKTIPMEIPRRLVFPQSGKRRDMHPKDVFSVLLHAGYLTCESYDGDTAMLRIPNDEVMREYDRNIDEWLSRSSATAFIDSIMKGDPERVIDEARRLTKDLDDNGRVHEGLYHFYLAGALTQQNSHTVIPEFSSGFGVADVGMIPIGRGDAIIVEFKVIKDGMDPETVADEAMRQVRDMRYGQWCRGEDALLYGMAVGKSAVVVRFERLRRVT